VAFPFDEKFCSVNPTNYKCCHARCNWTLRPLLQRSWWFGTLVYSHETTSSELPVCWVGCWVAGWAGDKLKIRWILFEVMILWKFQTQMRRSTRASLPLLTRVHRWDLFSFSGQHSIFYKTFGCHLFQWLPSLSYWNQVSRIDLSYYYPFRLRFSHSQALFDSPSWALPFVCVCCTGGSCGV